MPFYLHNTRNILGWITLLCSPLPLLAKSYYVILILAYDGIKSDFGYQGDLVASWMTDLVALVTVVVLLLFSRFLLGHWKSHILFFLLGIVAVILIQDISMILSASEF